MVAHADGFRLLDRHHAERHALDRGRTLRGQRRWRRAIGFASGQQDRKQDRGRQNPHTLSPLLRDTQS